jgi:excisionase family DNA binding protein
MTNYDNRKRLTYTLAEAGALLGLTENSIRSRVWRGKLPAVRLGKRLLIRRTDLLNAIEPR